MRILIISHEYPPIGGGGANACLNLAAQFADQGQDVDILTVWYDGLKETEEIQKEKGTINIKRIKARRKYKEHCSFAEMLSFLLKVCKNASKQVEETKKVGQAYDICLVFFGIPSGPVGMLLKRKHRIPYVIRFGGGDIPGFQERFNIVYKLIKPFIRIIWKNANGLVANSEGLREMAKAFCDQYPIDVFPNGVDTEAFYPPKSAPKKADGKSDVARILFVSRLIERKGLQCFIPNIRNVEETTKKRVNLIIVGDGPYRQTLEEIVEENDVKDRVLFAGQKEKPELLKYYQNADIFILPSLKEGMPNVVLEAMACGLPIVMSPCQGSKELVNGNGIIADKELSRFHDSVCRMIMLSEEDRNKMARISRKRAENEFSWTHVAEKYLELFKRVIQN